VARPELTTDVVVTSEVTTLVEPLFVTVDVTALVTVVVVGGAAVVDGAGPKTYEITAPVVT
jgi:hypothetical protein